MTGPHQVAFDELVDYVEGRLDAGQALRVSEHLKSGCPQCANDVRWLQHVLGLMAADRLVDAPPAAIRRAQHLYRPPRRRAVVLPPPRSSWLRNPARVRYVTAVALATLLILTSSWWIWSNANVAQAATLSQVQGLVEVRLPGTDSWQTAIPGMALAAGSVLRSGQDGAAMLSYPDGSRTSLTENTEVEIVSLSSHRDGCAVSVRLRQTAGHTQLELASARSYARVETADGVAEGMSGDYEVSITEAGVDVYAGHARVTLRAAGEEASLAAGERGQFRQGRLVVVTPEPGTSEKSKGKPTPRPSGKGRGTLASPSSRKEPPGHEKRELGTPTGMLRQDDAAPELLLPVVGADPTTLEATVTPTPTSIAPDQAGRQSTSRSRSRGRARHLGTPTPTPVIPEP